MRPISFTRWVYLDTNIYSHLAKNTQLWGPLGEFLLANDLCLGVSGGNLVELFEAPHLHERLADLLRFMPSGALKPWCEILSEEVHSHPAPRAAPLWNYVFWQHAFDPQGHAKVLGCLQDERWRSTRVQQLADARRFRDAILPLEKNFPPAKSGKYEKSQLPKYIEGTVATWLLSEHPKFLARYQGRTEDIHVDTFRTLKLYGLFLFHKYYLAGHEPRDPSDFGDLFHLMPLPYCKLAIVERGSCEILREIKRGDNVLASTDIQHIGFFQDWQWTDFP